MRSQAGVRPGVVLACLVVATLGATSARGLPLFARSENARCQRCHLSAPVLNPDGLRFLGNGYRVPGEPARPPAGAGSLPVSLLAEVGVRVASLDTASAGGTRGRRNSGDFGQYLLDLHAGGTLSERVSFGIEASLDSLASQVGTPVLFVQFDDLVAGGGLAVRVGRWESGLPFLAGERRPTRLPYLAPVDWQAEGIELNGERAGWSYATGLVNSTRAAPAGATGGRSLNRLEDGYGWLMREAAGQLFGARVLSDHQDSNVSFHAFLQRLLIEAGASLGSDRFRIAPAYVLDRFDDRPAPGIHQRHQYLLLESTVALDASRSWALTARLEHEHVTPTVLTRGEDRDLEALRLAGWLTRATRVAIEGSHVGDNTAGPSATRIEATVLLAY